MKEKKEKRINLKFFLIPSLALAFIVVFLAGSYLKPLNLKQYFEGDTIIAAGESFPVHIRFVNNQNINPKDELSLLYSLRDKQDITVLTGKKELLFEKDYFHADIFVPENTQLGVYKVDLLVGIEGQEHPAISHTEVKIEKRYFGYFMRNWLRALPLILIPSILYYLYLRLRKKTITS